VTLREAWWFAEWGSCEQIIRNDASFFLAVEKIKFDGQQALIHSHIFTCVEFARKLLLELQVKSELPSSLKAYRRQQHRWTCGAANLFRKTGKEILLTKVTLLITIQ
jgi:hypothetical protein